MAPRTEGAHPELRDREPQGGTEPREKQTLHRQMTQDPPAGRPDHRPHGQLPGPPLAAGEHQARHVGAGRQQHQESGAEQQEERLAHRTDEPLGQGDGGHRAVSVLGRVLNLQPAHHGVELVARRRQRHATLQAGDRGQRPSVPPQGLDPGEAVLVAALLLDPLRHSESAPRLPAGRLGRRSPAEALGDLHLQMEGDLVVQLVLELVARQEVASSSDQRLRHSHDERLHAVPRTRETAVARVCH